MRVPLIAGNWKMYKTINEAVQLANELKRQLLDFKQAEIVLCPSFTNLASVYEVIIDTNIKLGAQDLFWEKEGAYTGEISPIMLKDCGCDYVIVGHSERRQYFCETDDKVNKKLKTALDTGLMPICCVGEVLEEREADMTIEVIEKQLQAAFDGFFAPDMESVVIAYEPVWAIGTGRTATPEQAQEVHKFIRGWIEKKHSRALAQSLRILYGGSVKPGNAAELIRQEDIDGALVGGASLDSASFTEIVRNSIV